MRKELFLRSIVFWFLFIPVAVVNGIIRNSFYQPLVGDLPAHQISSIIFSLLFITYSYWFVKSYKGNIERNDLVKIGILWLMLTIIFEFGFGHYVVGHSWKKLLADYNILQGRVWFLVLVVIIFSPLAAEKLSRSRKA